MCLGAEGNGATADRAGADRAAMLLALFLGAVLIAFAPILVRLSEVGPVASGFFRVALAFPILALMHASREATGRTRHGIAARDFLLLVAAGVFLALDLGIWHISIRMTSVANATLFNNSAPIFVALAVWIGGARLGRRFVLALGVAVAGMVLLSTGGRLQAGPGDLVGDALALSTGAFYAAYILIIADVRKRLPTGICMLVSTLAAIPFLFLFSRILGEVMLPLTWRGWAVLGALALVCHVAGQGLIARALAVLPTASSATALLVQPVAAALLAWLFFAETQGPVEIAGIGAVLFGIAIAQRSVWVDHDRA